MLNFQQFMNDFDFLLKDEVIGFFNSFEIVEVFAIERKTQRIINILTVAAAQEEQFEKQPMDKLTPDLINLKGLKNLSFGIVKNVFSIQQVRDALENLDKTGVWQIGKKPMLIGSLEPIN